MENTLSNCIESLKREITCIEYLSVETNDDSLAGTLNHRITKLKQIVESLSHVSNSITGLS
jgi:hypothetical protein